MQIRSKYYCLLLTLAALLLFPWLGSREVSTRGEGREAIVSQTIFNSGNWILPRRYGSDIPSKPPLSHWIAATSAKIYGEVNEFTVRFPSALFSFLVLTLFPILAIRLAKDDKDAELTKKRALWATFLTLTSVEWFRTSITARVDMTLTGCLVVGVLCFALGFKQKMNWLLVLATLAFSGATLTKGPIGIVLPGLILILWQYLEKENLFKAVFRTAAVCLPALILPAFWYLLAYGQGGKEFLDLVLQENLGRFFSTMAEGEDPHSHSVFYLIITLIVGLLPWSIFIPVYVSSSSRASGDDKDSPNSVVSPLSFKEKAKKGLDRIRSVIQSGNSMDRLAIAAATVTVIFFSIPASKRSVYLLPAYPFICWLFCSRLVVGEQNSNFAIALPRLRRIANLPAWIALAIAVILGIFLAFISFSWVADTLNSLVPKVSAFRQLFASYLSFDKWAVTLITAIGSYVVLFKSSATTTSPVVSFASGWFLVLLLASSVILPLSDSVTAISPVAQAIRQSNRDNLPIYTFDSKNYPLDFYLDDTLSDFRVGGDCKAPYLIVAETDRIEDFKAALNPTHIATELLRSAKKVVGKDPKIALFLIEEGSNSK